MRFLRLFLFTLFAAQTAAGQNLLQNSDFASDLSRWLVRVRTTNTVTWSPLDYAGQAGSGSAYLVNDAPCEPTGSTSYLCDMPALEQCVSVQPSRPYRVGLTGFIPSGPSAGGLIWTGVTYYAQANCLGPALLFPSTGSRPVGSWQSHSIVFPSPVGSSSALVQFGAVRDSFPTGTFHAHVDSAVFEDASAAPESIPVGPFAHAILALLLASVAVRRLMPTA